MRFCGDCGNPTVEGARFCGSCGAELTQATPIVDLPGAAPPSPELPRVAPEPVPPMNQLSPAPLSTPVNPEHSPKGLPSLNQPSSKSDPPIVPHDVPEVGGDPRPRGSEVPPPPAANTASSPRAACERCGEPSDSKARFCSSCGADSADSTIGRVAPTSCVRCGAAPQPGDQFCDNCGEALLVPHRTCPTCGQSWPST